LYRYNRGLNLQQLIEERWPKNTFFSLKSLVLAKLKATLILLSSRLGHTKVLKFGDQDAILIYFMGLTLKFFGVRFIYFCFWKLDVLYTYMLLFLRSTNMYFPNGSNEIEDI